MDILRWILWPYDSLARRLVTESRMAIVFKILGPLFVCEHALYRAGEWVFGCLHDLTGRIADGFDRLVRHCEPDVREYWARKYPH